MKFFLTPKILFEAHSSASGEILVETQFGQKNLKVGGITQSGWLVKSFWQKVLKKLKKEDLKVARVLVLGLGGGTVVPLLGKFWPGAKIIGVELDPAVVKLGKKYFGLNKFKNLKIKIGNAFKLVSGNLKKEKFDLILVDLYLGKKYPPEGESETFLREVKNKLAKDGVVVFNRLKTDDTESFEKKLRRCFFQVKVVKATTNLLFLARS